MYARAVTGPVRGPVQGPIWSNKDWIVNNIGGQSALDLRPSFEGRNIVDADGHPIWLHATNQGTYGEDFIGDAETILSYGANAVRFVGVRWGSGNGGYGAGINCYSANPAENFISPSHLQYLEDVCDWAEKRGLWIVFVFDSNYGAGADDHGIGSGNWNFWETSAEQALYWEQYKTMQRFVISRLRKKRRIAMYELLAEPMPQGANSSHAALLRSKYQELIDNANSVDNVTPHLIGPRDSYGLNFLDELDALLVANPGRLAVTADFLSNKVSDESSIQFDLKTIYDYSVSRNVPAVLQQFGRRSVEDTGDSTTTDNPGVTALTGGLFTCALMGLHVIHWQFHQNTINPDEYALFHKLVAGVSAPDNWVPKLNEIAVFKWAMRLNGWRLMSEAIYWCTQMGWKMAFPLDDLSNVWKDAAGTIPATTAGDVIHRIDNVVGGGYWSQSGADTLCPVLTARANGGWTLTWTSANNQFLSSSDQPYFTYATDSTGNILAIFSGTPEASGSNRVGLNCGNSSGTARYPYLAVLATDLATFSQRGDDNVNQDSQSATLCDNRPIVISAVRAASNDKQLKLNGVREGTDNTTGIGSIASLTRLRWGASSSGGNGWGGKSFGVAIGKTNVTNAEARRAVERWFAWCEGANYRGPIPAVPSWDQDRKLGMNAPILTDWDKSHPFVDLIATARGFRPYGDPYSEVNLAAVKANGQPAEDFSVIVLSNGVASDQGAYLGRFSGTGTPQVITGDVTISAVSTVDNITTFTVTRNTIPGTSDDTIQLRFQNISADFGDTVPLELLRVGVPRGTGRIWGQDWLDHLKVATWFRDMNWRLVNNSTEVGPEGAVAWNTTPWKYGHRLSTSIDLCNLKGMHLWTNVPALSNGEYRDKFILQIQKTLAAGLYAKVEYSNEPWNTFFVAYTQNFNLTLASTQAKYGAGQITSLVRASGVITCVLSGGALPGHGKVPGQQISIAGARSNAQGDWVAEVVTLIAGTTGNTLVWNSSQSGSDTADIGNATTINLNPTSPYCAPTSTLPPADVYQAKENYDIIQTRDLYNRTITLGAWRVRVALGLKLAEVERVPRMMQWSKDTYGDCQWLDWCPAYYSQPADQAGVTTEQLVKDALDADRLVIRQRLWQFIIACKTYNATNYALYEMGPHNDIKYANTQAAVAAVHASDWMRTFAKTLYQDTCNLTNALAVWFQAGAVDTYGTTVNNTWCVCSPNIGSYKTCAKWKAANEMAWQPYTPVAVDTLTWGDINCSDAIPWIVTRGAGNLIIPTNVVLPADGLTWPLRVDTAGVKTITVNCCNNFDNDTVDILIDGVLVADNVALPDQNPYAEAANQAWQGTPTLSAGEHTITLRFASTGRGAQIGLRNIVCA